MTYEGPDRRSEDTHVRNIAEEAATRAVEKTAPIVVKSTLVSLGIDPDNPIEAQKDSAFVRQTRKRCETASNKAIITMIGLLVLGGLGALWTGIKAAINS